MEPRDDLPTDDASWADLVDVRAGDRVLLVGTPDSPAHRVLSRTTTAVTVVDGAEALPGPGAGPEAGSWDWVCLDSTAAAVPASRWAALLAEAGRVVVVGDNRVSPVHVLDRWSGRSRGGTAEGRCRGRRRTQRDLVAAGLGVHQVFGLIRSAQAPAVAFDALVDTSSAAVLQATVAHVGGWRGAALRSVAHLSPQRLLGVCPGWLVVAGRGEAAADRVVGKVSNRDSEEVKLLRGDPVSSVERRYLVSDPTAEVAALRELEVAGFPLAPRVLGESGAASSWCSWMPGATLTLDRLDDDALVAWVARAARVLAELQRLTRRADGTVLVHGDFWLGNLLTDGERVSAVVDWTESSRGPASLDRDFLVTSLERWIGSDALRERLEAARDEAMG
ncbi:phosphotransferase [Nocardioides sp.]|uniref:phosphotransferase n=1 Tax=Nocardioides sp. TaxID=35761 RepID=UPI0032190AC9